MMSLEELAQEVQCMYDASAHKDATNLVAKTLNIKLKILDQEYRKYFKDDSYWRYVFKVKLSRGRKSYTLTFGQSILEGDREPDMYSILSCLTKYDPGSFENFCADFGYDEDSRTAKKVYKDVLKEYDAMCRLFSEEELDVLQLIW